MSGTLQLTLDLQTRDPAVLSSQASFVVRDATATTHDRVDPTPIDVATSGAVGAVFVDHPTSVRQIERIVADVPSGADVVFRFGGAVATVLGSVSSPSISGGETIELAIDAGDPVETELEAGDTTIAKIAKRINFAHGAQIASVDGTTGKLRLTGVLTGGADAKAKGFAYGEIEIVGGTGLSALGLTEGSTFGSGDDQRVGPGLFAKTFPSGARPSRLELSGTASGLKVWTAGKAS
jgi:hypothetical protein